MGWGECVCGGYVGVIREEGEDEERSERNSPNTSFIFS